MKWLKAVLIPLAIISVVLAVALRLFGWMPWGFGAGAFLKLANTLFLIIIVVLLLRIVRQNEVI